MDSFGEPVGAGRSACEYQVGPKEGLNKEFIQLTYSQITERAWVLAGDFQKAQRQQEAPSDNGT